MGGIFTNKTSFKLFNIDFYFFCYFFNNKTILLINLFENDHKILFFLIFNSLSKKIILVLKNFVLIIFLYPIKSTNYNLY